MATTKHATIRYQALDKCFRNPGVGTILMI